MSKNTFFLTFNYFKCQQYFTYSVKQSFNANNQTMVLYLYKNRWKFDCLNKICYKFTSL